MYRISKYDFNKDLRSQWTSIWDIADPQYGLSMEEYLYSENMHIECVKEIVRLTGDETFNIEGFEYCEDDFREKNREICPVKCMIYDMLDSDRKAPVFTLLLNGERSFSKDCAADLMRFLLREEAWYKIAGRNIKIDTGYDYYIHLYGDLVIPDSLMKKYGRLNFEYFDESEKSFKE